MNAKNKVVRGMMIMIQMEANLFQLRAMSLERRLLSTLLQVMLYSELTGRSPKLVDT